MPVTFTSRLPEIAAGLQPKASMVVAKTTADVEADWKAGAPVDTGAYRNSIQGEAEGLRGEVSTGLEYPEYLEYGTRHMAAQPSAVPAAEQNRGPFLAAMGQIVK